MSSRSLAIALGLALANPASAVMFDPDGAGNLSALEVASFDWNNTSFLADGGQTAIRNFLGRGNSTFDLYTHAALSTLQGPGGAALATPGLNSSFEITMIAGFGQRVTSVLDLNALTGGLVPESRVGFSGTPGGQLSSGRSAFLEIYFGAVNSNALSGSGFGDGTLLLRAGLVENAATGSFSIANNVAAAPLDGSGPNQWPGVSTLSGAGSQTSLVLGDLSFINPDFFKLAPGDSLKIQFSNISISLPFNSTNPSDCFNLPGALCSADSPGAPRLEAGDGLLIPQLGLVNGLFDSNGQDFIAQTDYNSPFQVVSAPPIPVPPSVWLLGSALAGMVTVGRRRG
jgi:hypothetical protein